MNPYLKNLNRIEFLITLACTGRCKHCSEGEHASSGEYIDSSAAVRTIDRVCSEFQIDSLMTFGGEPLLHLDDVCRIHRAAWECRIPKRQLITNGFFSKNPETIKKAAEGLMQSGVNALLLSVDAFHQETIPLEPVKCFAQSAKAAGIPIRTQPAWLVSREDPNPYNQKTAAILQEFQAMGIEPAEGNVVFPSGNALKFLSEYFEGREIHSDPYAENPVDIRSISISPNGDVLGGNIYQDDILKIMERYVPM